MPTPARHTRLTALMTLVGLGLATVVAGCGASPSAKSGAGSAQNSTASASRDELNDLWSQFQTLADRPAVPLTTNLGLKPVAGFTQADVDALTRRAVDVLKRGIQPRLSKMDPNKVIDYVFANQYDQTTFKFKTDSSDYLAGYSSDWLAASIYQKTPTTAPKVVKVAAKVARDSGKLDDGTTAPLLRVTVQAHAAQLVRSASGKVPIVVRRTVQVSGFKPRGGPDWWPGILADTSPYGNAECPLYDGSKLIPLTDPGSLRKDLAALKISLGSKGMVPQTFGEPVSASKFRKYVNKTCK